MDALARLLALPQSDREALGLAHTPSEILQQPGTWRRTFQRVLRLAPAVEEFLLRSGLRGVDPTSVSVVLLGAGTSDYIGKSLCALLQKLWRCEVQAIPSTDMLTNMTEHVLPGRSYLWISFSRSGDSSEGVAVLESALERYPEIHQLIVTCNTLGKMARSFSHHPRVFSIVLDDEVNDRGLAMTSAFTNMVIAGQALAHLGDLESYEKILNEMALVTSLVLPTMADLSERLVREGFSKICFLGSGALKGAATESALKVLELTNGRVMSFSESFLGLRHGPLSAIDRETLLVSFLSANATRRAFELDLVKEICDKGLTGKFAIVSPTGIPDSVLVKLDKGTIVLGFEEEIPDSYRPPVDVILGQLLGLFASLREGLKPDTPSPQGAISRVVSHVTIY
jgi:tagatose-6-phosphate ketose/aldose isomerase